MKPAKISVYELFYRERRYVVPLYQRPYVWTQEDQWEPLWEDIERQADACLAAESDDFMPKRSHFLGAVVLNVERILGGAVARSEVIDGQQRLTTLQLFLAALRDYADTINAPDSARIARLTANIDEQPRSESAFKIWPTNADREEFQTVMTAGSVQAVLNKLKRQRASDLTKISGAYAYFSRVIAEYVGEDGNVEGEAKAKKVFALLQATRVALHFVLIELEDGDDPQVIFETLNARGQPLLPSDLIRNYIFMQAAADRRLSSDLLYETYWREFDTRRSIRPLSNEDRFWHTLERQGRLLRPRIDLFLYHYLVLKTGRELPITELYGEFRDWREAEPLPLQELLADLKAHSEVFAALILPQGNNSIARFASRLKTLDTSTVYPLLMYVLSFPPEGLQPKCRDQILADLESWLVRRMVCQSTTKNYNRFFVQLLNLAKQAATPADLPVVIRQELSRSTEPTLNWPTDQDFLRCWLSKPIYVKSRPDRSAMILRALEARIRTPKSEPVTLLEGLTVEHLLPQQGKLSDYPYADSMPLEQEETPERCRQRLINTMGNLTLLTRELNSTVSNGPFTAKAEGIRVDSDLRLNAWLRSESWTLWSESDIQQRGRELMEAALLEWPSPPYRAGEGASDQAGVSEAASSAALHSTEGRGGNNRGTKLIRHACRVDGKAYDSVYRAFVDLGLNLSKHQKFRLELKQSATGSAVYEEAGKRYGFELGDAY